MGEYSPHANSGRRRFAPKLLPTVTTLAAVAAFTALGVWQLGRAAEKRALLDDYRRAGAAVELRRLPSGAPRFQRVTAAGHYDAARQFLHDNRVHDGVPGVDVLTPLVLMDGSAVLVNRGWLPLDLSRRDLPEIAVGGERRGVNGFIDDLPRTPIELPVRTARDWPKLVQYPRMKELETLLGRELHPRVLLLDPSEPDGYVREWQPPGAPPSRHVAYAAQWFAFAAAAVIIWIVMSRPRQESAP
jgi:surfeit locus 1 family protein